VPPIRNTVPTEVVGQFDKKTDDGSVIYNLDDWRARPLPKSFKATSIPVLGAPPAEGTLYYDSSRDCLMAYTGSYGSWGPVSNDSLSDANLESHPIDCSECGKLAIFLKNDYICMECRKERNEGGS
jgi:hypothetical protein